MARSAWEDAPGPATLSLAMPASTTTTMESALTDASKKRVWLVAVESMCVVCQYGELLELGHL